MTPFGYHNSEMTRIHGEERKLARESIRLAKLAQQQATEEESAGVLAHDTASPGRWHDLLQSMNWRKSRPIFRLTKPGSQ